MDFDASNYLYYGDRNSSSIWKITVNGVLLRDRIEIIENTSVWSLAYDWINNDLYWSDDRYLVVLCINIILLDNFLDQMYCTKNRC